MFLKGFRILAKAIPQMSTASRSIHSLSTKQWKLYDEHDVINHVANIFLCSTNDANALVSYAKDDFERDRCGRIEVLRALRKNGINMKHLLSCKHLVKQPSEFIKHRMEFCSNMLQDTSPEIVILVLRLREEDFISFRRLITTNSTKVREFSELVNCSKIETCQCFMKYPFLLRSKISTLRSKLNLLVANGISIEEIKKDLWVLTYTMKKLETRIKDLKDMKFDPIKPWMLRCLRRVLVRAYQNRQDNLAAMDPYPNLVAYLTNRLGITEEDVKIFAQKHPPVMRVQISKINEIIDFLLSEGYQAEKIFLTPRILCHSLLTIQGRLKALKERDYIPQSLSTLCKSKRSLMTSFVRLICIRNQQNDTLQLQVD